ncbi:MAG: replication-associated recombination protein A [Candidatus Dormibacteraeota bacterium]|uniref:Replication-associated recombination protein A n=1 Tax=Candidatus Amunia macphersoniae TaxID=3127014 RepID=A0A934KP71_9BACT|nr:replication-associated recombination protein A [Candidatus Dormibacteraeota bacterium]
MGDPQADLFGVPASGVTVPGGEPAAPGAQPPGRSPVPLAARMRPRTLEEFAGQDRVVGPGSVLRRALDGDQLPSLILWGPPGSGKTSLANILAEMSGAAFESVSAVSSGVAELRKIMDRARERRRIGRRTVLFIDEIHRFNKGQQDAVLPDVESGTVTLLGATTENPSFEVNAALLSRARVLRLEALAEADLGGLVDRAIADETRGLGGDDVVLEPAARARLLSLCGGDARVALDALELAVAATRDRNGQAVVDVAAVEGALQNPSLLYDRAGDQHYWLASAFIKSMRDSDPDASVYWLARMLEAGEDPMFCARRMVIFAAEDVGLADPAALGVAVAAQQAAHFVGMPEGYLPLAEAALYLATAPKSNSAMRAYLKAVDDVRETLHQPVPLHLRNASTALTKGMGFGAGYRYAHDQADAIVDQQHLPDSLAGHRYYTPSNHGSEADIAARLGQISATVQARRSAGGEGAPADDQSSTVGHH